MEAGEPGSKSVPIKHTRPKVQKFDNGFIIEDTHMGPAQGKVGCPALMKTALIAIRQRGSLLSVVMKLHVQGLLQATESRLRRSVL